MAIDTERRNWHLCMYRISFFLCLAGLVGCADQSCDREDLENENAEAILDQPWYEIAKSHRISRSGVEMVKCVETLTPPVWLMSQLDREGVGYVVEEENFGDSEISIFVTMTAGKGEEKREMWFARGLDRCEARAEELGLTVDKRSGLQ